MRFRCCVRRLIAAVSPTADEMAESRRSAAAAFEGKPEAAAPSVERKYGVEPFFSFTYDGKPSAELLRTWELKRASRQLDDQRTRAHAHLHRSEDRAGASAASASSTAIFPPWNGRCTSRTPSDKDTPILADIQALDIQLERSPGRVGADGVPPASPRRAALATRNDYQPLETVLGARGREADRGGRRAADQQRPVLLQRATVRQARA